MEELPSTFRASPCSLQGPGLRPAASSTRKGSRAPDEPAQAQHLAACRWPWDTGGHGLGHVTTLWVVCWAHVGLRAGTNCSITLNKAEWAAQTCRDATPTFHSPTRSRLRAAGCPGAAASEPLAHVPWRPWGSGPECLAVPFYGTFPSTVL